MSTKIAPMLAELRQDHRNMARLLALLERQAQGIFDGAETELGLLVDVMRYMTGYPDAVHHPKEDKLYSELRAVRPDLAKGMSRVSDDHRMIADLGILLREMLEEAASGNMVPRKDLVANALRYVTMQREHMRWEESDMFRRIDRMVRDGHEVVEVSTILGYRDPLFGAALEARFQSLYDAIDA